MFYKSLFLLVFANLFNQAYQLQQIDCPKWVPGSNEVLPRGVTLSPELELQNRVRCFCEVVKQKERECIARRVPKNLCKARTTRWVEDNLLLNQGYQLLNNVAPVPTRDRMINVEP
tara:strand:- start:925 stop:1272 length:348 start_codon:yes stop_codon:yes gene_type:complete